MNRKSRAALISIICNCLLFGFKFFLAFITGSLALLADAYHSASDIVVSFLVFLGIKISDRKRISSVLRIGIENGLVIVISFLIFFAAYTIFKEAIGKMFISIDYLPFALIGTLFNIFVIHLLANYKIKVGKETKSASLEADGYHSRTDVYSSIVVLIALLGYMIGLKLDEPAAIIIALIIVSIGVELITGAIKTILTKTPLKFTPLRIKKLGFLLKPWTVMKNFVVLKRNAILATLFITFFIIYFSSGIYIITPGEIAIEQRWGAIIEQNIKSGIYYHLPAPIERVNITSTSNIERIEIGFRTREKYEVEPDAYLWQVTHELGKYEKLYDEALMVTGGKNIVDMDAVIHYRIKYPEDYIFSVETPEELIRASTETAIRTVVAGEKIDDLLTTERSFIEDSIKSLIEKKVTDYNAGIEIMKVIIHEVHPPLDVVPAFRSIINAKEDRVRFIHEAESEYNEKIPDAEALASELVEDAHAYIDEKYAYAYGRSSAFIEKNRVYRKAPDITEFDLYFRLAGDVLKDIDKFIVISPASKEILDLRPVFRTEEIPGGNK